MSHNHRHARAVVPVLAAAMLTVLSACAPASLDRESLGLQAVISNLRSDRGATGTYKIGEFVRFAFRLERAGYVTLVTADSKGVYELERNLAANAGETVLPSRTDVNAAGDRAAYQISPPAGAQRVILVYTDAPGPSKQDQRIENPSSNADLERNVRDFIERSGARVRDVREITVEVQPR